jgi:hypothetical protein
LGLIPNVKALEPPMAETKGVLAPPYPILTEGTDYRSLQMGGNGGDRSRRAPPGPPGGAFRGSRKRR